MSAVHSTVMTAGGPELRLVNGKRRSGVTVRCSGCGEERTVRADAAASNCKRCSARKGGMAPKPSRRTGRARRCGRCGRKYWWRPSEGDRAFCSPACANKAKRRYAPQARVCLACGGRFVYVPRPRSNSSGRYCSRSCRDRGYVGLYHGRPARGSRGYRPGWSRISKKFRAAGNDFCCLCGRTDGRLAVHHLEPYRVSRNNRQENLVTACPGCHARMERISDRIESLTASRRRVVLGRLRRVLDRLWLLNRPAPKLAAGS
jgi:hypothetical protein